MTKTTTKLDTTTTTAAPGRLLLPPNLAALSKLCGDTTRYALGGVRLEHTDGGYRAVASDGRRLAIVDGPQAAPDHDYPDLPALTAAGNGASAALVPSAAWQEAFKLPPRGSRLKAALHSLACVIGPDET